MRSTIPARGQQRRLQKSPAFVLDVLALQSISKEGPVVGGRILNAGGTDDAPSDKKAANEIQLERWAKLGERNELRKERVSKEPTEVQLQEFTIGMRPQALPKGMLHKHQRAQCICQRCKHHC